MQAERDFDAMVRAHYSALCDFVYRYVRSHDVAKDVVQDVFARIWKHADSFDYADPLPYLYRAARNGALSHLRRERTRARFQPDIERSLPNVPTPADDLDYSALEDAIRRAVDALPERCRLIYTMNREQGRSYAEIARILDISVSTVEVQMWRALKTLRARLAPFLSAGGVLLAATDIAGRFIR